MKTLLLSALLCLPVAAPAQVLTKEQIATQQAAALAVQVEVSINQFFTSQSMAGVQYTDAVNQWWAGAAEVIAADKELARLDKVLLLTSTDADASKRPDVTRERIQGTIRTLAAGNWKDAGFRGADEPSPQFRAKLAAMLDQYSYEVWAESLLAVKTQSEKRRIK